MTAYEQGSNKDRSQNSYSWSELAEMTHKDQVEIFGWCSCEDNEGNPNPFEDCLTSDLCQLGER